MQNHKIICIPNVIFRFDRSLHKLIEFVHIDIYEKLRSEISKRETNLFSSERRKTIDDVTEKIQHITILNMLCQNIFQDCVIDICKELSNIAFQYPTGACIIF